MSDLLVRSFSTVLERTDRRTLDGLFVPWDVPADVTDVVVDRDGNPKVERYREGFRRGAFDRQATADEPGVVRRIVLRDQHHDGLGKLGHVVALRNVDAGLHGTVRILPSRLDDVDALLDDGVDGLSAEFHPLGRPDLDPNGTVWRTRAHLVAVALEAQARVRDRSGPRASRRGGSRGGGPSPRRRSDDGNSKTSTRGSPRRVTADPRVWHSSFSTATVSLPSRPSSL